MTFPCTKSFSDLRTSQPHRNHGARVASPVIDSGSEVRGAAAGAVLPFITMKWFVHLGPKPEYGHWTPLFS